MIRMQFDGSSTAEAINQCTSAVEKLMEHVPVTTLGVASVHPNQPPTEVPAPGAQVVQFFRKYLLISKRELVFYPF